MSGPVIEQAIFTSVRGATMDGYQLVATSPGIAADESRELAVWGPAHDSLLDPRQGAQSINFHALKSGRFGVSLTTALDAEYSGRGGCQIYTHTLVVAPETLRRFANDPFRLLDAALVNGFLTPLRKFPPALATLTLPGAASAVHGSLLTRVARRPGPAAMASLVEAALTQRALAIATELPLRSVIAGLLNLLPAPCRTEFSFTTGLRHASRRPFRLSPLPADVEERRRVAAAGVATLFEMEATGDRAAPQSGWAGYISAMLRDNQIVQFSRLLSNPPCDSACQNLDELAASLASATRPRPAAVN